MGGKHVYSKIRNSEEQVGIREVLKAQHKVIGELSSNISPRVYRSLLVVACLSSE